MKKNIVIYIFIFLAGRVLAFNFVEEVTYNNIKFTVIKDNGDSLTMLKSKPLYANDLSNFDYGRVNQYNQYNVGYPSVTYTKEAVSSDGYWGMAYYSSEDCTNVKNGLTSGCKENYEESDVKYVVDS